jgi:hypothetical protein
VKRIVGIRAKAIGGDVLDTSRRSVWPDQLGDTLARGGYRLSICRAGMHREAEAEQRLGVAPVAAPNLQDVA